MNILDHIKQKAAEKAAGKSTIAPVVPIKPSDVNLEKITRGHGFDAKSLKKMQSQINREESASIKSDEAKRAGMLADAKLETAVDEMIRVQDADFVKGLGITLDESQEYSLIGMLENQYCVLIGAAGTGKTTLTKEYIKRLLRIVPIADVACAAFTGRASQQMRRALPPELQANVSTIHSLLEFMPDEEKYDFIDPLTNELTIGVRRCFKPQRTASNKLTQSVFIFDEAGMIGCNLWNLFMEACPKNARIVLIGDIHQLPPVMDKSVLGFAMNVWPVFELTKIHRQTEGNAIIDNAHRILKGETMKNAPNFHLIGGENMPGGASSAQIKVIQWLRQLADKGLFDPMRDAFIVPQNGGPDAFTPLGQEELNPHLVMMFNPPREENGIIVNKRFDIHTGMDRASFAVGDKVMCTSNLNTVSPPITNGMVGVIESINLNGKYDQKRSQFVEGLDEEVDLSDFDADNFADTMEEIEKSQEKEDKAQSRDQRQSSHVMTVKFEGGQSLPCSTAGDYRRIKHAYAFTCHKAQGGEYPNVVILVHSANHRMLSQEWLYTAVTRGRENVYIFYNNRGMKQALERQKIKGNTLQEKISAYNMEAKTFNLEESKRPILWKARKADVLPKMEEVS